MAEPYSLVAANEQLGDGVRADARGVDSHGRRRRGFTIPVTVSVQSGPAPSSGREWSTVMGDLGNRYSTLNQINTQTVSRLGAVWMSERLTPPANSRSMTVVKNGMMYFTAPPNVVKIDARTGKTVWRFTAGGGGARGGRRRCATDGRTRPRRCCNRRWSCLCRDVRRAGHRAPRRHRRARGTSYVGEDARDKGQGIAGAPVYAGGIVSVGLSADNGWRGQVVGLDGKTGREVWRWFAVPAPGELAARHKTAQWKFGGGALADGRRGRRVRPRLLRHRQRHSSALR